MELFVFTFLGLALAAGAMAIGPMLGRAPLRRGCGTPWAGACEGCARPCPRRSGGDASADDGGNAP